MGMKCQRLQLLSLGSWGRMAIPLPLSPNLTTDSVWSVI